ncbi:sirohydrochlorin cobaltochelatase [Clostridium saccharobutylicum]|nr:sirohydrochlorin cobaltochelatase [Clostridium saccharobutylicum]AQR91505.1 sirohydrochlorin cobaltochelatase [Clostridium saccharobutylicum]AQS01410.1 sirohydrochlorin cobaltochelatase [Clostridium saccharobutylicum]AQS11019.1 sirohydrochlorin cobaltochelatase [Clostridium saccharobutylicum]AQS15393.1 sirohydrochlorin cobaltochelatase [Clostridium saccharobutylicum]MBA2906163.1 sirohydrochlorin cobaltochelatase [Clostridium saccharobutylicum]
MKKAILVVSFGTSHLDALKSSIDKIENRIKDEFKGYDVFRAFTAHMIIKKLKVTHDMVIFTPEEALEDLKNKGYEEVVVQPLHIIPGEEFDYIKGIVRRYNKNFESIKLGRPIFFYQGMDELPKDYSLFIESIKDVLNNEESVVLFGHGTAHSGNAVYGMLQTVLEDEGYDNVFVATVEGYPTIQSCLNRMKKKGVTKTKLVPLLLVAGDHAKNDMASDEEDSLKSVLQRNDIEVKLHIHGLGEIDSFGDLYITRIYDTIEDRYLNAGKTKKLRKH